MARGINKVILIGNLGNDPDVRYAGNERAVANISIATSESWKDKNTGEKQERTEWHRIVFFGRLAEIVSEYLRKGSKVYVEGRLQTNKWQDKSGNDRYTTEIIASEMQMLDSKGSTGGGQRNKGAADEYADTGSRRQERPAAASGASQGEDFADDDIPF